MDPQIKSYLLKKLGYSDELDDNAFKEAQATNKENQYKVGMARAAQTIGAAMSGNAVDDGFFNQMNHQSEQNIHGLLQRRMAESQEESLKAAQMQNAKTQSRMDPNSTDSSAFRKVIETGFPTVPKMYGDQWNSVTAADQDLIWKPLEVQEQIRSRKEDGYNRANTEMINRIEQGKSRGATKNAWEAKRLVENAQSILDEYPDLNKMPQAKVALFIEELGKIAKGGSSTEGTQKALMPASVNSGFNAALSKLTNRSTGAELGDFLKTYGSYLNALKENSHHFIGDNIKNELMAYKNRVRHEDYDNVQNSYAEFLSNPQAAQNQVKRIRVSNGKETHDILPQDLQAALADGYKQVQ